MPSVDDLLSRARVAHQPCEQADIDMAAARITARAAAASLGGEPAVRRALLAQPPADAGQAAAARDLTVLCEAVINHPAALTALKRFFARVPGPAGARVLGCMLELTGRPDSARFLWQYAAGAGDAAAAYCLTLHHHALGETDEAEWWQAQTDAALTPAGDNDFEEIDPPTALRILRVLKSGALKAPGPVTAVLRYVPAAVAFVDDDLDLPLPDTDFAERIHALTTASRPAPAAGRRPDPLPARTADLPRPRIPASS
ncbi:hypothetical protein [Streptomyces sp. NPDC020141]|uniref:hypothetical protein n=1 Tax=Streptomyces sp. NPDC020141 TaxID=3365065 RepID=UPI003796AE69